MSDAKSEEKPQTQADEKNNKDPKKQIPGVEKKIFVRRVVIYGFLWALLIALWQGLPVFGHDLIYLSLVCLLMSFIVGPLGIRRSLRNYAATKKIANWCTLPILFGGLGLSLFLFLHEYAASPPDPKIDLLKGDSLDAKDPFGATFIINNLGERTISNVWAVARFQENESPNVHMLLATNPIPELKPGRRYGLHFADYGPIPLFASSTYVTIEIRYTPSGSGRETNTDFGFCIRRDATGNYVWIEAGDGETLEKMEVKIDTQKFPATKLVPLLGIHINSVTNSPVLDHPFELVFSWQNEGGMPATGVYIEWAVLEPMLKDKFIRLWTNRWPVLVMKDVLMPNQSRWIRMLYQDQSHPTILTNVLCGNYVLLGAALFKDLDGHEYQEHFKAIGTNGAFEVRYVDFGGHFKKIGLFQHIKQGN